MTGPTARHASKDEIHEVGALIALSYNDLDLDPTLVPPLGDRQHVCGRYFTLHTQHAVNYGRIEVIENREGLSAAAVWFDHTRDVPDVTDEHRCRALRIAQPPGHEFPR